MAETFDYDVFLSHSAKDKDVVCKLAERLQKDGLRVWFDEWIIQPGDSIPVKIEEGLERSRALILCMSGNALSSDWVTFERNTILFPDPANTRRRFIPLRLDDSEIKATLKQFAYVDWRERTSKEYARILAACQFVASTARNVSTKLRHLRPEFSEQLHCFGRPPWAG